LNHFWYAEPAVWGYFAAAAAFSWLAVRLLVHWHSGGNPALLLGMAVAAAAASGASAMFATLPNAAIWEFASILDFARSAALIIFLLAFLGVRDPGRQAQRGGTEWVLLGVIAAVLLVAQMLLSVEPPGIAAPIFGLQSLPFVAELAVPVFGLVLVEQCYRRTPTGLRWHVRPMLLGLAGVLAFDVVLYSDGLLFRVLDPGLWSARGFAQAITVPLLIATLARTPDWSFKLSLSRSVLSGTTALLAIGSYLLILSGAGFLLREFGGSWGRALQVSLVFAALLALGVVALSSTARAKVRVLVAKHFFTYRYDYREEWLRLTNTLTSGSAAHPWAACIEALGNLVESPGGALWSRSADGGFRQVERSSFPRDETLVDEDGAFLTFLRRSGWVLDIRDVSAHPEKYDGLTLPPLIAAARDAWVVVPLQTAQELVGFVVLITPRVQIELDWEVLDLLKAAGRQAASYLAYARAAEALLEAQKFDAFHRMSTFVVHDLKNLIAQLQLLLSNAERHRDNPDFQRDMLKTIEHVVGRMHQLTLQLRPEASGRDRLQPVDVSAIARRVVALRTGQRDGVNVEAADGILVWAHEDLLERVISHLVQNGIEASDKDVDVVVRIMRDVEGVVIEVSDHGKGMTPEFVRDRLFKPFQTTKATGMGIGAFETQQYVQDIGGRIEVHSAPGAGTRVRLCVRAVEPVSAQMEVYQ